ncbi:MAG: GNAT family N-acetyltransferase [Proteobacteria bacterium]|nr:GNAT family N-acetyltransferase [Pseudomonadota bacterium]
MKNLHLYLTTEGRHIFILKKSDAVIGFALVNKHLRFNTDGFSVAEFYIQKKYERKGYGRRLAEHVFEEFKGEWEVAVTKKNKPALVFWGQVVPSYTKGEFLKKQKASFSGYGFVFDLATGPAGFKRSL